MIPAGTLRRRAERRARAPRGLTPRAVWAALTGFGPLHAAGTALNMGFTLAQLLVLARVLPIERYAEIVFLTAAGLYGQPISQAVGRANFLVLRAGRVTGAIDDRPDLRIVLGGQAAALLIAALAVPCALAPFGSERWLGDALFLALALSFNVWAFDLQSAAWALDRALPFVRLALAQRAAHFAALALAWWSGSFMAFAGPAALATALAIAMALRMLVRAGLFARTERTVWRRYVNLLRTSGLATLVDLTVLSAPYALVGARFGIGPTLVAFDCTMKLVRITMAGARTLAEIALPRHSRLVALDRGAGAGARRLYLGVCALSLAGAAVPALALLIDGRLIFAALLGSDGVVPAAAAVPAAGIVLVSGLYQSVVFFLSYGDRPDVVGWLVAAGAAALGGLALALWALPPSVPATLTAFGIGFLAVTVAAARLSRRPSIAAAAATGLRDQASEVVGL